MLPRDASEKKGGRNKASLVQPGLIAAVEAAVDDRTAGSPMKDTLRWTNRSPQDIANALGEMGFSVCPDTVRRILTEDLDLHLRQARKEEPAKKYPFRNEQFEYISELRAWCTKHGWPILSLDTKKKESLGNFFRPGAAYTDGILRVLDHDFATLGAGRLVPYGLYDLVRNEGFVLLSYGADTSELACDTVWQWWQKIGRWRWRRADGLLLLCDCGGGNGNRRHRFKEDLKQLAIQLGRTIQVAHYPPGSSKYNPIEHRMFCHVTRALRGVVLSTMDVAKEFISRTRTSTGLRVIVETTEKIYEKARKATRRFLDNMPVVYDTFLPDLNYSVTPYLY
jgi:hypothetical protein